MKCLRYMLSTTALLMTSAAAAQDNVHKTLDKWRYPEPANQCTIKYSEEDYYLFIADSVKPRLDSYKPVKRDQSTLGNRHEPPEEQHSSDKAATSFYLKEY
ncbi:MAG: hypothetical protein EOP56_07380 [Sphingobacteriales bacterium]|nr:MAG: hypothetical protein EOP56_07380 [Sphingobacteriales bacterium]